MQVYLVGGAVRDKLLGRPVADRDYVVVGATPEHMSAAGFLPVGRDFPVFLHPDTHEEYALARTERKQGHGYTGFVFHASPEVTLEEDLRRRDLTINAMAEDAEGRLIDPYGGRADLEQRRLRHVSEAFVEDPLRVLRLARFAARFPDFEVVPETLDLCRKLVASGELEHLAAERVWQEISRGLMEVQPSRMFECLRACGALAVLAPEIDRLWGVPQKPNWHPEIDTGVHIMQAIDYAARRGWPLATRFAVLAHDLGKGLTPSAILPAHHGHEARSLRLAQALSQRWRVPNEVADLARLVAAEHGLVGRLLEMRPATLHDWLIHRCDALRRPERFASFLDACEADVCSRRIAGDPEPESPDFPPREQALCLLDALRSVDAAALAQEEQAAGRSERIAERLRTARMQALSQAQTRLRLHSNLG